MALTSKLTAIADAIRAKTGGSAKLSLDDMPTAIASINVSSGGEEPAEIIAAGYGEGGLLTIDIDTIGDDFDCIAFFLEGNADYYELPSIYVTAGIFVKQSSSMYALTVDTSDGEMLINTPSAVSYDDGDIYVEDYAYSDGIGFANGTYTEIAIKM